MFFNVSNGERAPRAVKDVLETLGGLIYHGEDCHFSNGFAKHGKDFDIEVANNNYLGIQEMLVYLSQFISNILNNRIFSSVRLSETTRIVPSLGSLFIGSK